MMARLLFQWSGEYTSHDIIFLEESPRKCCHSSSERNQMKEMSKLCLYVERIMNMRLEKFDDYKARIKGICKRWEMKLFEFEAGDDWWEII